MLLESRDGATVILTLDYPARRNALAIPMRQAIVDAMERIEPDPTIRAIVFTGSGGTFSAGGDISSMDVDTLGAARERFRLAHRLIRMLIKSSKPIIAAVEGYAVGAGLSFALCADTIVAGDTAQFAAGFGRIGLVADLGLLHTLPARIGQGRARQILLYGDRIGAPQAASMGLIDQIVPAATALDTALALAQRFHDMAPLPIALTKQYLATGLDAALDWEREAQSTLFTTADHAEGKAAFMAKRAPQFAGR